MKFKFAIFLVLMLFSVVLVYAQRGNFQQRTVMEKVNSVHEKFDSAFKFDAAKQGKIDSVFATYFRQQEKIRQELSSGDERYDRETMMGKMQPALESMDKELKAILSEEEYKKWKDEIKPSMMKRSRQ